MSTDLRAALRIACKKLHGLTPHASADENAEIGAWQDLADAPLTVAELLPLVVNSTREVRWTDTDGDQWRAFAVGGGRPIGFAFRRGAGLNWYDGNPCDLTQPATIVEVA